LNSLHCVNHSLKFEILKRPPVNDLQQSRELGAAIGTDAALTSFVAASDPGRAGLSPNAR